MAITQSPCAIKNNEPVVTIPMKANKPKKNFFLFEISASAPKKGATITIAKPESEFAVPSHAELSEGLKSPAQKLLKKIGKNPAITVVANAELAQS